MKILHIIDHMGVGGAQTILKGIFEVEKYNENIFCYALWSNNIKVEINHPNMYSYAGYSKLNIKSLFKLRTLVHDHNIDVLHCHLVKSMFYGYILKLLFFKNITLIFHEHGRIFQNKVWYGQLIKKTQNKVDLYIAVSKATKIRLENIGIKKDKIKLLYNFVDLDKFNPTQIKKVDRIKNRKKFGLNEMDFVIGFAGRLNEIKGCDVLIKSVPNINIKNIKLLVAGDGVEKDNLENLVKELNIAENVIFLNYISNIIIFYGVIDCLVIPSRSEASPMVFYEIQALGIPLIANDVTALNEFIIDGDNGLLFQTNNEKDLAKKINLVYDNGGLREKLIINGLDTITNYSLDNYLTNLRRIYEVMQK